ncbi:MAG TPA: LysR family transcriptional regulator [Candidatus Binatia bacterium]|jgi:DNA-binding transcriptional LysR family regulator
MTLWQLKVFTTVAKTGSFTKAAKILQITQPSATTLVQTLSREVGVKLFEKLGAKIHITSAGEEALRFAHQMLEKVHNFKQRMDEFSGLRTEKISIGAAPIAAATFLPTIMQKFKEKYPGIEVTLKVESNEKMEIDLLESDLDLAFMSWLPSSHLLVSEHYYEEEFVAIAPPKHPLTNKRRVSLGQISKEPLIAPQNNSTVRKMLKQRFALEGLDFTPAINISEIFGVRDLIRNFVAKGLGIGFIAKCHVIGDIQAGRVKLLHVPELNLKRDIHIVIHRSRQNAAPVRAFRDLLKKEEPGVKDLPMVIRARN